MGSVSEHPEGEAAADQQPASTPDPAQRQAARAALLAIGITFFGIGVVFTAVTPDNLALGITFLLVGTVLFWAGGMPKPPASGRGDRMVPPGDGEQGA